MARQGSREQQGITLRGSAEIVAEFFCKGMRGRSATGVEWRWEEGGRTDEREGSW